MNRAVESIALVYVQPTLHHLLGLALSRVGRREEAEQVLRTALQQAPEFAAAHEALGRLISRDRTRAHRARRRVPPTGEGAPGDAPSDRPGIGANRAGVRIAGV